MTITSGGDQGCTFVGTYTAADTDYQGNYTCPGGITNIFAVTTHAAG